MKAASVPVGVDKPTQSVPVGFVMPLHVAVARSPAGTVAGVAVTTVDSTGPNHRH